MIFTKAMSFLHCEWKAILYLSKHKRSTSTRKWKMDKVPGTLCFIFFVSFFVPVTVGFIADRCRTNIPLKSAALHRYDRQYKHYSSSESHSHVTTTLLLESVSSISNGIDYSFLRDDTGTKYTKEDLHDEQIDLITKLVQRRASARNDGNYNLADTIRDEIKELSAHMIPSGFEIAIKDIARKDGGGSTWSLQALGESIEWMGTKQDGGDEVDSANDKSVLQIAHAALGLASWSSENCVPLSQEKLLDLVTQAKKRLRKTGCRELRGRKAADSCFWFAMAGVNDDVQQNSIQDDLNFSLFDALVFICCEELRRFGHRSSCRITDIMQMVERIAAAGVRSEMTLSLQKQALECLSVKNLSSVDLIGTKSFLDLEAGTFGLHSERSLLWIWRFSTRQRKQQTFLKSALKHWESRNHVPNIETNNKDQSIQLKAPKWNEVFVDPTLPLVVDIGCGMGISILGLAISSNKDAKIDNESIINLDWQNCNLLGADLSQLAINYASSISYRWKLKGRVHFEVTSAEEVLENIIRSYPGPVKLIMTQFPTPFSFQMDIANEDDTNDALHSVVIQGNKQLPKSLYSGFMVTENLLDLALRAIDSSGKLLLQSNCEDVAVLMKNIACEVGFKAMNQDFCVTNLNDRKSVLIPKRTEKWIAMGGERAEGIYWSSKPLLPVLGSTETELACIMRGRPVHRCMLEANGTDN